MRFRSKPGARRSSVTIRARAGRRHCLPGTDCFARSPSRCPCSEDSRSSLLAKSTTWGQDHPRVEKDGLAPTRSAACRSFRSFRSYRRSSGPRSSLPSVRLPMQRHRGKCLRPAGSHRGRWPRCTPGRRGPGSHRWGPFPAREYAPITATSDRSFGSAATPAPSAPAHRPCARSSGTAPRRHASRPGPPGPSPASHG